MLGRMVPPSKSPSVEIDVDDRVVRVSNPDRVYFPESGATKLDLVQYYLAVGPGIVNALFERPCMLHRFPTGVGGDKVHQKRLPAGAPPWVETVQLHFPRWNRTADELCVTELASVIWAVQMSTVEFHPWNSRRDDTEKPDEWRIDLDPGPECDWATVRRVAGIVHEVSPSSGAVGFPRRAAGLVCTSTSASLPAHGFADVRRAALRVRPGGRAPLGGRCHYRLVAQGPRPRPALRRLQPERPGPHHRGGVLGAGRAERRVSAPVRWDEVDAAEPQDFTMLHRAATLRRDR
jgi:DNA primase